MTVTSKPNEGDPIVEEVVNPVTGRAFIATRQFWRFLDELSSSVNSSLVLDDAATALAGIQARLANVESKITEDPFTIDSAGWTVDTSYITADMAKA